MSGVFNRAENVRFIASVRKSFVSDASSQKLVAVVTRNVKSCRSNREPLGEDNFRVILLLYGLQARIVISKDTSCLVRSQSFVTNYNEGRI